MYSKLVGLSVTDIVVVDNRVQLNLNVGSKILCGEGIVDGSLVTDIYFVYNNVDGLNDIQLILNYLKLNNIKYTFIDSNNGKEGLVFIRVDETLVCN